VLSKTDPVNHIPTKKQTKEQDVTLVTTSEFTDNKQKLTVAKAGKEKITDPKKHP
jgi:hypothetical protein